MAASFTLELDTQPPEVDWGVPPDGQTNHDYSAPITLDEGSVLSAELVDEDGNEYDMATGPELEVYVPATARDGVAFMRAFVRDEVWNEAVRVSPGFTLHPGINAPPLDFPLTADVEDDHAVATVQDGLARAVVEDALAVGKPQEQETAVTVEEDHAVPVVNEDETTANVEDGDE